MAEAITYIPLLITSLSLAIISFMKAKKSKKIFWIITALVFWLGSILWTLFKLGVIK